MKIITISKIGYNSPSGANWSYKVWKVDTIDTSNEYNMSYTVKETFGGDSRFRDILEKAGVKVLETKGVCTSRGIQKITGVNGLGDIENKLFIADLIEWYNKK